jgi:glycosyltransferase involved in cell wall biosynthesis
MLFTNKLSPFVKLPVPTAIIPHDMQFYEAENIPGLNYSPRYLKIVKWQIAKDFALRDHIIAISDSDRDEILKFFPEVRDKVVRIYDPVNFDRISAQSDGEKKYITALNIQHPHKNCETLIRAFELVRDRVPYDLLLVGKKPGDAEKWEGYFAEHGMADRAGFTGFVTDQQLARIIDETDIYVNPSYFEGFGMTAIEMMGRRIPTIVADNSASKETTMGLCRYYAPTGDAKALAEQIMKLVETPESVEKLESISKRLREEYDYRKVSEEYWSKLRAMIN